MILARAADAPREDWFRMIVAPPAPDIRARGFAGIAPGPSAEVPRLSGEAQELLIVDCGLRIDASADCGLDCRLPIAANPQSTLGNRVDPQSAIRSPQSTIANRQSRQSAISNPQSAIHVIPNPSRQLA
jgi:hypothetical protein